MIGCCNKPELLNNNLTKKTNKITDFFIRVKYDSLDKLSQDTVVIIEKYYNKNDQIISRIQRNLFDNGIIKIDMFYNDFNEIQKEIVEMTNDSLKFTVNYFYKDSLLQQSLSESKNNQFRFKQIGTYEHYSNKSLKKSSYLHQYFDVETNDTILNSLEISKYNEKEQLYETKNINKKNPERNSTIKSDYKCSLLYKEREYNEKDSLISTTKYKYEFDEFGNWIKRKSTKNGKLNYIKIRNIDYK